MHSDSLLKTFIVDPHRDHLIHTISVTWRTIAKSEYFSLETTLRSKAIHYQFKKKTNNLYFYN